MQNLLNDPLFYQLLTNNNENSTLEPMNNPNQQQLVNYNHNGNGNDQHNQNDGRIGINSEIKTEDLSSIDFSFLDNFMPMSMDFNIDQVPQVPQQQVSQQQVPQIQRTKDEDQTSEQSFTNSVFSQDNYAVDSSIGSMMDLGNINDFSKDQHSQQHPQQQHVKTPESKQFHKFYTSTFNTKGNLTTTTQISKPSLTYHKCPFCQRQFKNKSYLSRHLKKHDSIKDFKCPFFNESSTKCHHLNGEFSRKDTFKAHLKSIHFIYPIGVAKNERNLSSGRCAGCFKEFENNNLWLNNHIEKEECSGFAKE